MTRSGRPVEKTPECELGMCRLCPGPKEIRVAGYSVPAVVIRCGCTCHGGKTHRA